MVEELMLRLDRIDRALDVEGIRRDFSEKLHSSAATTAEAASERSKILAKAYRRVMVMIFVGLLLWTPVVSYGAVWVHEKIRNNCYVISNHRPVKADDHWYCNIFPNTQHMNMSH